MQSAQANQVGQEPIPAGSRQTLGLAVISAASLAFEISLTRLFAIQQFHHFAFLVVSLAVMGTAASGSLLALGRGSRSLSALALAFTLSVLATFAVLHWLPFDSYTLAWDPRQSAVLALYLLAAATPFLFAGWVIGACLAEAGPRAHLPYAANLAGSGCGAMGGLLALDRLPPEGVVGLAASMGLAAAALFTSSSSRWRRASTAFFALALAAHSVRLPPSWHIPLSPYKPLSIILQMPDARLTLTWTSAAARLDVVETDSIHILPGLSLNAPAFLPEQAAAFLDGEGPLPITSLSPDDPRAITLAMHMPSSLAYLLRPQSRALILESGAGLEPLLALAAGAAEVNLPTDEPLLSDLLFGPYAAFTQDLLTHPGLKQLARTSRPALHLAAKPYDVIDFALSDGYHPVTSGAFSLREDYLLTVDAFRQAYRLLDDHGLLVVTRWLQTPPSEEVRLFATLLEALAREGVTDASAHVIAYRTLRTATILVCRRPFTSPELAQAQAFLRANAFDAILLPGLRPSDFNRYNRLPVDLYHDLFTALLADRSATLAQYPFNLRPPTDDRPYFFHFFRLAQTPDILATLGQTWQPFGGSGYLVLLALLGLMFALAIPLIALPLFLLRRRKAASPRRGPVFYFAALGAAYLLVEIPLLQRMTLLLEQPTRSLGIVLTSLLVASGIGSLLSVRLEARRSLLILVASLVGMSWLLSPVLSLALPWPLFARVVLAILWMAPAGFLMGIPFAAGLRRLEHRSPGLIPWAWAVNGAVSGVSGVLAALISLDAGHTATLLFGACAYALAWRTFPYQDHP